jgi:hypothetical protein
MRTLRLGVGHGKITKSTSQFDMFLEDIEEERTKPKFPVDGPDEDPDPEAAANVDPDEIEFKDAAEEDMEPMNEGDFWTQGWEMWKALVGADLINAGITLGLLGLGASVMGGYRIVKNMLFDRKQRADRKRRQELSREATARLQEIINQINEDPDIADLLNQIDPKNPKASKSIGDQINKKINEYFKSNPELADEIVGVLNDAGHSGYDQATRTREVKRGLGVYDKMKKEGDMDEGNMFDPSKTLSSAIKEIGRDDPDLAKKLLKQGFDKEEIQRALKADIAAEEEDGDIDEARYGRRSRYGATAAQRGYYDDGEAGRRRMRHARGNKFDDDPINPVRGGSTFKLEIKDENGNVVGYRDVEV